MKRSHLGARPLGECDEAVSGLQRGDGLPEGLHLRLAVAAAERDVSRELHRPADERDPQDLDLGDILDLPSAGRWWSVGALVLVDMVGVGGREPREQVSGGDGSSQGWGEGGTRPYKGPC